MKGVGIQEENPKEIKAFEGKGISGSVRLPKMLGGFPIVRGPFLGIPIIRTIIFWGSMLGIPYFGNYHLGNP